MTLFVDQHLDEFGERALIEKIFRPRYAKKNLSPDFFGDDCAVVCSNNITASDVLVATTDPCPEPMANFLGYTDPYYRGWLLATINLSDLAAVGASPLGLLTSLILRNDMTIGQLLRLLDGIDDCCQKCSTQVIGGNIKEGGKIDLSATAIGVCRESKFLSRSGCSPNDLIIVIGDLGLFWAGTLAVQNDIAVSGKEARLLGNVLTPIPKLSVGIKIAERGLMTSCLDNSDGLYPSLAQLAESNNLQMHVNMQHVNLPPECTFVGSKLQLEPIRFAFGWGDWQLIGCCKPKDLNEIISIAKFCGTQVFVIGEVKTGSGVIFEHAGKVAPMAKIDSQRFTKDSWFSAGLPSYIERLTKGSLWDE